MDYLKFFIGLLYVYFSLFLVFSCIDFLFNSDRSFKFRFIESIKLGFELSFIIFLIGSVIVILIFLWVYYVQQYLFY